MPIATDDLYPGAVLGTGPNLPPPPKSNPFAPQFKQRVDDVADAHADAVNELLRAFDITPDTLRQQLPDRGSLPTLDEVLARNTPTDEQTPAEDQPSAANFDRKGTGWFDP